MKTESRFFSPFVYAVVFLVVCRLPAQKPERGEGLPIDNVSIRRVGFQMDVTSREYAAKGDGITDDTKAIQSAIDDADASGTVLLPARHTFRVSGLRLKPYSKLMGVGAKLVPSGPSQTVLTIPSGPTLQTIGKLLVEGVEIDGKGQAETIGVKIENNAQVELIAPFIHDCGAAGILLQGTQFADIYAPRLFNNYVGVKIYSDEMTGGGNSNNFFGGQIVGNEVGVLQFTPKFVQTANYFFNTSMLSNAEAAVAVIGSTDGSALYLIGGAPEGNARPNAPPSIVVDGHKIWRASVFADEFSTVYLDDVFIADAAAAPWSIIRNHSKLMLHDVSGYGKPSESFTLADSTSSVFFSGNSSTVGHFNNVAAWPASLDAPAGLWTAYGQPLFATAPVPNWVQGDPMAPLLSGNGIAGISRESDPNFGQLSTAAFLPKPGTSETNRVTFGAITRPIPDQADMLVSFLMKTTSNCESSCNFQAGIYPGGNGLGTHVNLTDGQWTRVVIVLPISRSRSDFAIVVYPTDSSGASVEFAAVEVISGLHQAVQTVQNFSQIIATGAVGGISERSAGQHPLTGAEPVFRCTTAGQLAAGVLTTIPANCGASLDTGIRVH